MNIYYTRIGKRQAEGIHRAHRTLREACDYILKTAPMMWPESAYADNMPRVRKLLKYALEIHDDFTCRDLTTCETYIVHMEDVFELRQLSLPSTER